jgi:DNA-binding transcriptional MocR family regulator
MLSSLCSRKAVCLFGRASQAQAARSRDGNVFAKSAIAQGVAFVPGAPFFCENPDNATFRLSFATVGEDKILEGVARLAKAL